MNKLSLLLAFILSLFLIITCYALQPDEDVEEQAYSRLYEPEYDSEKQLVETIHEASEELIPVIEVSEPDDLPQICPLSVPPHEQTSLLKFSIARAILFPITKRRCSRTGWHGI